MRCEKVLLLIDDHVDGLLPAADAERVRDHLDACGDCRASAEAARAASTSLRVWGDLEPPAHTFDAILAQVRALPPAALARPAAARRPSSFGAFASRAARFAVPALAAAAAVVAGFLVTETARTPAAPRHEFALEEAEIPRGRGGPRALRPGEEYVHAVPDWNGGLRRVGPSDASLFVPVDFRAPKPR